MSASSEPPPSAPTGLNVSTSVDSEEDPNASLDVSAMGRELQERLEEEDLDEKEERGGSSDSSSSSTSSRPPLNRDDSIETLTYSALAQEVSEMKEKEAEAERNRRLKEYDWEESESESEKEEEEEEEEDDDKFSMARIAKKAKVMPPPPPKRKKPETPLTSAEKKKAAPTPAIATPPSRPLEPRLQEGFLVWARLRGYPYWPGIITVDPVECVTAKFNDVGAPTKVHVHFLGYANQRAWVAEAAVIPFDGRDDFARRREEAPKAKKVDFTPNKKLERTFERGVVLCEDVHPLTNRQRLEKLGLVYVLIGSEAAAESAKRKRKPRKRKRESGKVNEEEGSAIVKEKEEGQKKEEEEKSSQASSSPPPKKAKRQRKSSSNNSNQSAIQSEPKAAAAASKSSDEGFEEAAASSGSNLPPSSPVPRRRKSTTSSTPVKETPKKKTTTLRKRKKTETTKEEEKKKDKEEVIKEEKQQARSVSRRSSFSSCSSPVRPTPLPLPSVAVTSPAPGLVDEIVDIHDTGGDDLESNDDDKNESSLAEDEDQIKLGGLVWGKLPGFPYWPCFVTRSPDGEFVRRTGKCPNFHVQFFNWNDESGWVSKALPWRALEEFKQYAKALPKGQRESAIPKGKGMLQKWTDAFLLAHSTAHMSRRERYTEHVVFYKRGKKAALQEEGIILDNLAKIGPQQQQALNQKQQQQQPAGLKKRRKNRAVKRCGRCVACKTDDCRKCLPCKNKVKYGGTGTMKNICCLKRRCTTKGYSKSWTLDEDKVEVAGTAAKVSKAAVDGNNTAGVEGAAKKRKKPSCSPQRKAKSYQAPSKEKKVESEPEEDDPSSAGVFKKFLSRLYPSDLPKGWSLDTRRPGKASMTQLFQSPEGQTFTSFSDVVGYLFQQNVAPVKNLKRSLSCSDLNQCKEENSSEKGWLLRNGDRLRYGESELSTDAAGCLEGRFRFIEDASLPRGWLVKRLRAKEYLSPPSEDIHLYTYRLESGGDPLSFTSKEETASYLESKGHPALELEHLTSLCALRERSPAVREACALRERSRLTVQLSPSTASEYASHPILGKAVAHSYVDMVKLPDIFLDHPTVNVRETSNEMVITDVDTEEFIAKKIMYE